MKVLISQEQISGRVQALAKEISKDYQNTPVTILGVLTGSLIFVADIVRHLEMPLRIGFVQASSYRGKSTEPERLHIHPEIMPDVQDRHILLIDDILDSGQTLDTLVKHVNNCGAASLRVCVLLRKLGKQKISVKVDYHGFDIPDKFVVGYGLDYDDEYRNLPYLAELPDQAT